MNLGLDAGMLRAGPAMSSDFDFERYYATVRAQGFAGITGPEDFLFRYVRGIGTGSRAMPLFELFQLGGNNSVRGIEQGEFVGRSIAFDQSEVGVNTASVWRWVSRKQGQPKPAPGATAGGAAGSGRPVLIEARHFQYFCGGLLRSRKGNAGFVSSATFWICSTLCTDMVARRNCADCARGPGWAI